MREFKLEKKCRQYAIELGYLCYKFKSPQNNAVPDRILISPSGEVLFIEFKAPGKEPSALQSATIEEFQKRGCNVFIVDNFEDGKSLLEQGVWI